MLGSPNLYRGNAPLAMRLKIDDLHAQLAPLDRYGVGGFDDGRLLRDSPRLWECVALCSLLQSRWRTRC
jgi:hypothetical protein